MLVVMEGVQEGREKLAAKMTLIKLMQQKKDCSSNLLVSTNHKNLLLKLVQGLIVSALTLVSSQCRDPSIFILKPLEFRMIFCIDFFVFLPSRRSCSNNKGGRFPEIIRKETSRTPHYKSLYPSRQAVPCLSGAAFDFGKLSPRWWTHVRCCSSWFLPLKAETSC